MEQKEKKKAQENLVFVCVVELKHTPQEQGAPLL
jgi:hypothetical protein